MLRVIGSAFALSALSINAYAAQLSGQVLDEYKVPLQEGTVQIMGSNLKASLDAQGRFSFDNLPVGAIELHVSSPKIIHTSTSVSVPEQGVMDLVIEVANSSLEIFDVTASAFHASTIESAAPVNVLGSDELRLKQANTLGDTLKNEVGVHSTFYAGVSSSPIIRGLDGPRVLITQNGMDAGDASRVGPDHLVATDTSTATQVEVLRGPATLFYGSGAIGGVINVVDQRIPTSNDLQGQVSVERNSNNGQQSFAGDIITGTDNIAVNVQGYYRDSNSYRIPGFAESEGVHDDEHDDDMHDDEMHEEGTYGYVDNTQSLSKGATFGMSYLLDKGHIGFAIEHTSSVYGIPGHAHGSHEDVHEDEEHDEEEHGADEVSGDMQQNRYQVAAQYQLDQAWLQSFSAIMAYTDYQHAEIEGGEIGTQFKNQSHEARFELLHRPIAGWRGGLSLHYKASDFEAIGEEAFTPPSEYKSWGLGLIEEQHFGDFLVQLGARVEDTNIDVAQLQIGDIEVHAHEEEMHEEEEHEEHADLDTLQGTSASFNPYSLSAGVVWDFAQGYNIGLSFVHAQRAPSASELYSFGPHIGTSTYEVGAFFDIDEDGIELSEQSLALEKSNNIDLSIRKFSGDLGYVFNIFYNKVDNYYYSANTGLFAEGHAEHEEEHEGEEIVLEEEHADELPVFLYRAQDVSLYGAEAEINWQVSNEFSMKAQADIIRNKLSGDQTEKYLPRTPPARFGISSHYDADKWSADLSAMHYFSQTKITSFESKTAGYTLVDANVNYYMDIADTEVVLYAKVRNLLNEDARVHTSFLKDIAPLPSRSAIIGVRAFF